MALRSILLALTLGGLSAAASAQLDLPKKRARVPAVKPGPAVGEPATAPGDPTPRPGEGEVPLDLPPGSEGAFQEGVPGASGPGEYAATPEGAAAYYIDQLARLRDADSPLARGAVANLAALGPPGLAACRRTLSVDHAVQLLVVGRVLLRHGTPEDRRAVVNRMWAGLPRGTSAALLVELIEHDPVLASPEFLTSLLDHPDAALRKAAHRALEERANPALLPLLARPLAAGRTSARLLALDLVSRIDDPSVPHVLEGRLDDKNARVAARAAELLARLADPTVPDLLRTTAFATDPIERRGAYALLALVEREDGRGIALLDERHVPALLAGMRSSEPIVAGASAAALAGIGFRSELAGDWEWLDRDVPYTLVRTSSGAVFHQDFTSLQRPALGRLQLLSGLSFGRNGSAWQGWWADESEGFEARRSVLTVQPGDAPALLLRYLPDRWSTNDLLLVGPAVEFHDGAERVIYLAGEEAEELVAALTALGVFGAEHLPGTFGSELGPGRRLEVGFRQRSKRFELADEVVAPWLDAVAQEITKVERRNRWQRWGLPEEHGSQRAFWKAEREFWASDADALARALRLKALVFASLEAASAGDRGAGLEELATLYAEVGVPTADDFARFLALLEQETGYGPRAEALVDLALLAAETTGERPRPAGATIDPARGRELLALLSGRFTTFAADGVERVLAASGKEVAREAARGGSPFLRGAAAPTLARDPSEEDVTLLFVLLRDPDEIVQVLAIHAAGNHGVQAALSELLVRADYSPPAIRGAALLALARLGHEELQGLCLLALTEDDPELQVAAVTALAAANDPENATVLASLFARGPDSPLSTPARDGLVALGAAAWPQVLRMAQGASSGTRREATLLLAEQGMPEAASILITLLSDAPDDERVAMELAVLTGRDLRAEEHPALAWWDWWDEVVHDDSLAWLRAAAERRGLAAPPSAALAGDGSAAGARFLVELALVGPWHLSVRASRELERLLGAPVAAPPLAQPEAWGAELRARIESHWGGE